VFEAKARYMRQSERLYVRFGELGGRLYLELRNDTRQAVDIDANAGGLSIIRRCVFVVLPNAGVVGAGSGQIGRYAATVPQCSF